LGDRLVCALQFADFVGNLLRWLLDLQVNRNHKKGTRQMKKKNRKITLVKTFEQESVRVMLDVDDDLYEALARAGRQHLAKDKMACFEYALNKALLELCEELK
jgi:hypothetical protein